MNELTREEQERLGRESLALGEQSWLSGEKEGFKWGMTCGLLLGAAGMAVAIALFHKGGF